MYKHIAKRNRSLGYLQKYCERKELMWIVLVEFLMSWVYLRKEFK